MRRLKQQASIEDSDETLRALCLRIPVINRLFEPYLLPETGVGWASLFIFLGALWGVLSLFWTWDATRSWGELINAAGPSTLILIAVALYALNRMKEQMEREQAAQLLGAYKLALDEGGDRIAVNKHPIWQYLAAEYRWAPALITCPRDPLHFPAQILGANKVETVAIAKKFKDGQRAADFNCVIAATLGSSFVRDETSWCKWCEYFAEYFRKPDQKRHLVARVFSCPATFDSGSSDILKVELGEKVWKDGSACKQASWLLCYLLINEFCGVDTRLHLYQAGTVHRAERNDFFEFADYVLVHHYGEDTDGSLYVAIPGDEYHTHHFTDRLLVAAFTKEFYQRLVPGWSLADGGDTLIQVSPTSIGCICRSLGLEITDLDGLVSHISALNIAQDLKSALAEWLNLAKAALAARP